jgi:hypothetical protein
VRAPVCALNKPGIRNAPPTVRNGFPNMDTPEPPAHKPATLSKFDAILLSFFWGMVAFPGMAVTAIGLGQLPARLGIPVDWVYVPAIAVCATFGYLAGRHWVHLPEALLCTLPVSCGLGLVIWVIHGVAATLGQTPNAKWYGVPEGVVTASVFFLASGVGAARGRSPRAA